MSEENTQEAPAAPGPTPVSAWKKRGTPTTLPSGNAMILRRPGFQAFMKTGLIPNSLLGMAQSAIAQGKEPSEDELRDLVKDIDKVSDMMAMVDSVVVFCAVEPEVAPSPGVDAERDDQVLYVDEIDDEDKMFIFAYATGGTTDVESFRNEARDILGPLAAGQDMASST